MAAPEMLILRILALFLPLLLGLAVCGCTASNSAAPSKPRTEKVVIGGETFELELAADPESREKGLMHRTHIPDRGGMLFVFPDNQVRTQVFWMGHCLVDMDIIFLDRRGGVTATHRMKAQPPQRPDETDDQYRARIPHYSSGYPAQFAIELQAGSLDRLNVRVNDRIALDLERLKRLAR
jgi:uncharacterized protein